MQAVSALTELSTSVAIATSIWLLRKKNRLTRWCQAWRKAWRNGLAPAGNPTASRLAAPQPAPGPRGSSPVQPVAAAASARAAQAHPATIPAIEVVEDSGWHLWEAAIASEHNHLPAHKPGRQA